MATEARLDRPYTLNDLHEKFKDRAFAKAVLDDVDRRINMEEGKLKSLRLEREQAEGTLHAIEVVIMDISRKVEK